MEAINTKVENLITLQEASRLLPRVNGKRINLSTLWRWCRKGLRGVNLEYLRVGSKIVTTHEAMQRFFTVLAQADKTGQTSSTANRKHRPRPTNSAARQQALAEANTILVRAGILKATDVQQASFEGVR